MKGFNGFPDGKQTLITVPSLFFTELLPQIDHLTELQVTLYCFWALQAQEGSLRYVRFQEVLADETFIAGLKPPPHQTVADVLIDGFERAVARGTLLYVRVELRIGSEAIFFMNTSKGRRALEAIQNGDWVLGDHLRPIALIHERPNIYAEYEQNIGLITPMIADQLHDLEKDYPPIWIIEAMKIAVSNQKRSLPYIIAVLARWQREGRATTAQSHQTDLKQTLSDLMEK